MNKENLLVLPDYCKNMSMSEDLYSYLSEDHRLLNFNANARKSKDFCTEEFNWFKILFALMNELQIGHPSSCIYSRQAFIREINKTILSIKLICKTHFQEILSRKELILYLKGLEELPANLIDNNFIIKEYYNHRIFQARQDTYDTTYIVRPYSESMDKYSESPIYSDEIYTIILSS